jgi:hypothetical protein
MKRNLNEIADIIANTILREDFKLADEESKQAEKAKEIDSQDLRAPAKKKKETITDEGEEEEEEEAADAEEEEEEEKDIEAKPKPDSSEDDDDADDGFEVQAPDVIPAELSYKQIEKQINNLRAGKSLKDEEISGALEDYFDELGKGERDALFTYLASLGAILTGGTSASEAPRPSQLGIKIDRPEAEEENETPAGEPEPIGLPPGEAPIIVGEVANKYHELMTLLENLSSSDQHRCMDGQIVDFGSSSCIQDISARIDDTSDQRDSLRRGTSDRSSLNGALKYLRQKLRSAHKIQKQDNEEKLQGKLDLADSA